MEQLERTRRYLKRIRDIYAGVSTADRTNEDCADDVLSFFVHCHHIADWIATLNLVGVERSEVEGFVDEHRELRICTDLSNGTKHCRLTRKTRTKRQPHLASTQFRSGGGYTKGKFQILSDDEFFDALKLAEDCMKLWDEFVAALKGRPQRSTKQEAIPQ